MSNNIEMDFGGLSFECTNWVNVVSQQGQVSCSAE